MTDPINSTTRATTSTVGNSTSHTKTGSTGVTTSTSASHTTKDTVSLTSESMHLQEIQQSLADIPEVDAEKVALLKKQIAFGQYPVDASRIADKLVELELALDPSTRA